MNLWLCYCGGRGLCCSKTMVAGHNRSIYVVFSMSFAAHIFGMLLHFVLVGFACWFYWAHFRSYWPKFVLDFAPHFFGVIAER